MGSEYFWAFLTKKYPDKKNPENIRPNDQNVPLTDNVPV